MGGIIYAIFGFIVVTVVLRFVFRLFGANASNAFVSLVYSLSAPLVTPFAGIFGQDVAVDPAIGGVFEWASLLAIVVYGLIAAVVSRLVGGVRHRA